MGAISQRGVLALDTLNGSMKGDDFRTFIRTQLVPKLWPGAVVVMDNLAAHKVKGVEALIEKAGARILYLSPYSPDFNPIEMLWSQLKAFLRRFRPKTSVAVTQLLKLAVTLSDREHFQNWYTYCCYWALSFKRVIARI